MLKNKVSITTLVLWAMLATVPKPSEAAKSNALLLGQSLSPSLSVPDSLPKETTYATTIAGNPPVEQDNGSNPSGASPAEPTNGTATPEAENQGTFPWVWLLAPLGLLGLLLWWLKEKDSEPEPRLEPTNPPPDRTAIPPAATTETVNPPTPVSPAETMDSSAPVATAGTINPPPGASDSIVSDSPKTAIDNSTVIQPIGAELAPADTGSNLPLNAALAGGAGLAGAAITNAGNNDEAAATHQTPMDTAAGFPSDPDWEGTPETVDGELEVPVEKTPSRDINSSWADQPTLPPTEEMPPVVTGENQSDVTSSWADQPTLPPTEASENGNASWADRPTLPPPEASENDDASWVDEPVSPSDSPTTTDDSFSSPWADRPTLPPPEASENDDASWVDEPVSPSDSPATNDGTFSSRWTDEPTLPPPEARESGDASWVNEPETPADSPATNDSTFTSDDWGAAAVLGTAAGAAAAGTAATWENLDNPELAIDVPAENAESNVSDSLWQEDGESGGAATDALGGASESVEGTNQRIFLVPQDVHSAYAYWELPEMEKERLRNAGGQQMGLRLCDVTGMDPEGQEPHGWQHYDCTESTQYWDFDIPESDRDYLAELGYLTEDGQWLLAARSHPIRIPNSQAQFTPNDAIERSTETITGDAIADELSFSVSSPPIPTAAARGGEVLNAEVLLPPPGELWAIANVVASIQGATMPGATVTIDGQRVEVNPDGTFNLPLDLSEGAIERPIVVESTDGIETRLLQVQLSSRSPFDV